MEICTEWKAGGPEAPVDENTEKTIGKISKSDRGREDDELGESSCSCVSVSSGNTILCIVSHILLFSSVSLHLTHWKLLFLVISPSSLSLPLSLTLPPSLYRCQQLLSSLPF